MRGWWGKGGGQRSCLQRESQSSSPAESSQRSAGQSPEHRAYGTFISFKGVGRFMWRDFAQNSMPDKDHGGAKYS